MPVTSNADATMHNLCAMSKKFETVARTRVYKTAEIKGNRHALGRTNLSSGFSVALRSPVHRSLIKQIWHD